jgi:flagella basal body P-ring formation protein FlgA
MYPLLQVVSIWLVIPGALQDCVVVDGPTILASDLAPAVPALKALDGGTSFGYSPTFDMRRNLTAREINTVVRKHVGNSRVVERSVCVVRRSRILTEADVRAALTRAFEGRQVAVDVVDFSRRQVGPGELSFPLQVLPLAENYETPVVWRGWFRDPGGRRIAVWVKVRLKEAMQVAVASKDLVAGAILDRQVFSIETRNGFPLATPVRGPDWGEFEGRCLRRAIHQGDVIPAKTVDDAVAIRRGEPVTVVVNVNAARVQFEGKAETSARAGQSVAVSSPNSKRLILAKAVEKGKAIVQVQDASSRTKP